MQSQGLLNSKKIQIRKQFGFTLIELMVVVSIIGFLATILSVGLSNTRDRSLDTRRANDIFTIQKGINLYLAENQVFPPGDNTTLGAGTSCGGFACTCLSSAGFAASCPMGQTIYMAVVPGNPGNGGAPYVYGRDVSETDYTLTFSLDEAIGSLSAGAHTLSTSGIDGG